MKKLAPASVVRASVGTLLILGPCAFFGALLLHDAINLPNMDDYDTVFGFFNTFLTTHGFVSRISFVLSYQHMEYKLYFEQFAILLDYALTRQVSLMLLQQLGNLMVPLSAVVLWFMFFRRGEDLSTQLLLFAPVGSLIFAMGYVDTLDWLTGSLQNLTALFFMLLAIYLLSLESEIPFWFACLSFVLAMCSSGNGFFLSAVGAAFLWQQQRKWKLVAWLVITATIAFAYSYQYRPVHLSGGTHHPFRVALVFPFAFLGAAFGSPYQACVASVVIVGAIALMVKQGWRQMHPATFYVATFILITAAGVDTTRHRMGLEAAVVSRYRIYSQLLVAVLYLASIRLRIYTGLSPRLQRVAFASFMLLSMLFCLNADRVAAASLEKRTARLRSHYVEWQQDENGIALVPDEELPYSDWIGFRRQAVREFQQAVDLGYYHPQI